MEVKHHGFVPGCAVDQGPVREKLHIRPGRVARLCIVSLMECRFESDLPGNRGPLNDCDDRGDIGRLGLRAKNGRREHDWPRRAK